MQQTSDPACDIFRRCDHGTGRCPDTCRHLGTDICAPAVCRRSNRTERVKTAPDTCNTGRNRAAQAGHCRRHRGLDAVEGRGRGGFQCVPAACGRTANCGYRGSCKTLDAVPCSRDDRLDTIPAGVRQSFHCVPCACHGRFDRSSCRSSQRLDSIPCCGDNTLDTVPAGRCQRLYRTPCTGHGRFDSCCRRGHIGFHRRKAGLDGGLDAVPCARGTGCNGTPCGSHRGTHTCRSGLHRLADGRPALTVCLLHSPHGVGDGSRQRGGQILCRRSYKAGVGRDAVCQSLHEVRHPAFHICQRPLIRHREVQERADTVRHSRYGACHILNPRLDTGHNVADHVRAPRECLSSQTLDKGNCTVKAVRDGGLNTGNGRGNPGFHRVKSCGRRALDAVTEGRNRRLHGIPAGRNHRFDTIYHTGDFAADGAPDGRNRGLDC